MKADPPRAQPEARPCGALRTWARRFDMVDMVDT